MGCLVCLREIDRDTILSTAHLGAPLTYFNDRVGGGGGPSVFVGSEILTQSDFLGL